MPAVVKYRRLLGEVLVASLVLQLLGLITPLFFQVVMDKVLVHRAFTTLDVVAVAFLGVVVFEAVFSGLRTWLFSHTTSRIDVELGARLFRHLVNLPVSYFQSRRVGDSVARVQELENVRTFLTGHALTLVLDVLFSVVFLALMAWYSGWLTLVVLASWPLYALVSLLCTPLLRARIRERCARGAEHQSFLVETVSGIGTLKAMAVEPVWVRHWDQQLAAYVSASFRTTWLASLAQGGVTLISRLVTVCTLYMGARFVIAGELSVGQLIAFNMLAGQVAQPVMRLAQLWTDVQQMGVSVERMGDLLNTATELSGQRPAMPAVRGRVRLEDVRFRYQPDAPWVLAGVSLDIAPGQIVGVVGHSGSGKSTLTQLIQRLHIPTEGRVMVDGIDLATVDPGSLRRQIGVVLQDSLLFARSIRDNIALAVPAASMERVIDAARLAGAHDFITRLPQGYDTPVGEQGCSLSGGQRQRIAIARALIGQPRILVFDEATSALDYESERVIQDNMQAIAHGRTVIIVAHRLSAVRRAHHIFVMDQGQVSESGTHEALMRHPGGIYAALQRLQHA
ncbi:MAG: type I secretion system permease/ATPase [Comamonadaceae bacterium]|nr:type I secretion system permease/ATPase [Comamonadaceae bacterium]